MSELSIDPISSHAYSGCYGGETVNNADIIVTKISCPINNITLNGKQIIFVVDESGSMFSTIPSVKSSLFAARNSLLRLTGHNIKDLTENERDILFSDTCNCCLITFSDSAKLRWTSNLSSETHHGDTFSKAVNDIEADTCTNMGDALKLAFKLKQSDYATWIILLTDGVSNKGPCQTLDSYKNLLKDVPFNTKIIPLGYTTNFDPDVLSVLGNMTYIETEEHIAEIFGGIIGEIVTCYGMNAKINLPHLSSSNIETSNRNDILLPDDIIVVDDDINNQPRNVIGTTDVGCLFSERVFMHGWLPWGNTHRPSFSQYVNLKGSLQYYDIATKNEITLPFVISQGPNIVPDEVYDNYFASSKGRILLDIYRMRKHGKYTSHYINAIKTKLEDWNHPTACPHKEEILRILSSSGGLIESCQIVTRALSTRVQSNYTSNGRYSTNTQRGACRISSMEASEYINNDPNVIIDKTVVSRCTRN